MMSAAATIFLTGSAGLIGSRLRATLGARGARIIGCDTRAAAPAERYDFRDAQKVRAALTECDGIIHLGALSRVVWGEQFPALCRSINVDGTRAILAAAAAAPRKPWVLFGSSREVYGSPPRLPCTFNTPLRPENIYANSKLTAENMVLALRAHGNRTAILRFSGVFGAVNDYHDRVVPAFAKAAARNTVLEVRGAETLSEFTALSDAVDAAAKAVDALIAGEQGLPPIDVVCGRAVSLLELAKIAKYAGGGEIVCAPPRSYYPKRFQGDPRPAEKYLHWRPRQVLEQAVAQLIDDFRHSDKTDAHIKSDSWVSALL